MSRALLALVLAATSLACPAEEPTRNDPVDASDGGMDASDAQQRDAARDEPDAGADASAPPEDMSPDDAGDVSADAGSTLGRTLADYRVCERDEDCPVGLGRCITQLTFNRATPDGTTNLELHEVFTSLSPGQGVCSEDCTNGADACAPLSLNGVTPDPKPHVCQLVALAESPYPDPAPAFPFADTLDPNELALGQPFAALCRPPFELDPQVDDGLCSTCVVGSEECPGDSICYDMLGERIADMGAAGTCLAPCSTPDECPSGFVCASITDDAGDLQSACMPAMGTCTDCLDVDRDGIGAGRCTGDPNRPVSSVDCDDRDANAYYSMGNPEHPFPMFCGEHDYNCNGLRDDAEQVGPFAYPVEHCTACGDVCSGDVDNGTLGCRQRIVDGVDQPACVAVCDTDANGDPSFADCNEDPTDGCEVPIDDPTRIFYRDSDGDGAGDPSNSIFDCASSGTAPAGYVANTDDCDDADAARYIGNPEICDGKDNDCNMIVDDSAEGPISSSAILVDGAPVNQAAVGRSCTDARRHGICVPGVTACSPIEPGKVYCDENVSPGDVAEQCDDALDNDCDGLVDEGGADSVGSFDYYPDLDRDGVATDVVDPALVQNLCPGVASAMAVARQRGDCDDADAARYTGNPEICDGKDNDCNMIVDDSAEGPISSSAILVDGAPVNRAVIGRPCTDARRHGICVPGVTTCSPVEPGKVYCDENVSPGDEQEECGDLVDNDCDGAVDEGDGASGATNYYYDGDGDMFPANATPVPSCRPLANHTTRSSPLDCHDGTNLASPGNTAEACDLYDNDCDGSPNEGCPRGPISQTGAHSQGGANGYTSGATSAFQTHNLYCPSGQFMTKIATIVETGLYASINKIWIGCQDVRIRNTATDPNNPVYIFEHTPNASFQWLGNVPSNGAAGTYLEQGCGANGLITTLAGSHAPQRMVSLQSTCHALGVVDFDGPRVNTTLPRGVATQNPRMGELVSGRTDFTAACPDGEAAVGATVFTGPWAAGAQRVRGIEFRCAVVTPSVAP